MAVTIKYEKIDGIWYECRGMIVNLKQRLAIFNYKANGEFLMDSKRQLNSREIKKLGLK